MKVKLRNPDRELEVAGPRRVREVLADLDIDPDTVLVIRDKTLVTREERLEQDDEIEVRPVISGGAPDGVSGRARQVRSMSGPGAPPTTERTHQ
ncbi:MAG: MoaD/ThiS family protein [Actinomycetota bacterium]|nr:MoaD/ThiS family protein [Actinomycetota bacterium]